MENARIARIFCEDFARIARCLCEESLGAAREFRERIYENHEKVSREKRGNCEGLARTDGRVRLCRRKKECMTSDGST
jgi:hypothetical protein